MTPKRKGSKPAPRPVRQLQERTPDGVQVIQGPSTQPPFTLPVHRLGLRCDGPFPLDADTIAHSIDSRNDVLYFFDTTQFVARTDPRIWQAILKEKRLVITPPVFAELKWWLADPKENLEVHRAIKASLDGDENAPIAWVNLEKPELIRVCEYYVNLLGMRKKMFTFGRIKLEAQLGRPASKAEVSNYCQAIGASRAQLLGRQGENAKIQAHKYNDEVLVILALLFAISTGRNITIVSGDEAVLDQFYKAVWLIETHHRSMLMAEEYASNPLAFPVHHMNNEHKEAFLDDSIVLLQKPSNDLRELLPVEHTSVLVQCMLLQNATVTQMTFNAEMEFHRLLTIKARTNGLSTDRLQGKNCHAFLGDQAIEKMGHNWAAVATDRAVTLPGCEMKLSVVDVNLALRSDEHFSEVRIVDPPGKL